MSLTLATAKAPEERLALTNKVFVHPLDADALNKMSPPPLTEQDCNYVQVKKFVFTYAANDKVKKGEMGFSQNQRRICELSLNDPVPVNVFVPQSRNIYLARMDVEVDFLAKTKEATDTFAAEQLEEILRREFCHQVFTVGQQFVADVYGKNLRFSVSKVEVIALPDDKTAAASDAAPVSAPAERGILTRNTAFSFSKPAGSVIKIQGGESGGSRGAIFNPKFNFESMGIGALDKQFGDIFRRAFASRVCPPAVIQKLGIKHVKGMLLYGPPGTGKTLMARQIGAMLGAKPPKVVAGPEVLSKFVGQTEENIRLLFAEADLDEKQHGPDSELHIIIMDEMDAICRARGSRSDNTGVGDSAVNQLLAKIDGVESLNNILVIGMTNRKELLDEALLRPGRLEVHIEIGLPDQEGRLQILQIHTNKIRTNKMMEESVSLEELAEKSKNYSGAEIEGLVKDATSFAFNRHIDPAHLTNMTSASKIMVTRADFMHALEEIKPAFGVDTDEFANTMQNGVIKYGPRFKKLVSDAKLFVEQVRGSERTPLVTLLLEGQVGSGKTTVACSVALKSAFPYVKLVSPELLVGYSESSKCAKITKVFEDAYRSPLSVIVVDDIERLLDYVPIGPRFSNMVLQTLIVLFKKPPPKGRRLLVIGTTSSKHVMEEMGLMGCIDAKLNVPQIHEESEFKAVLQHIELFPEARMLEQATQAFVGDIGVKRLLMVAEMARQTSIDRRLERFVQCMQEFA